MPASPIDSPMYRDLFFDAEVGKLFTDSAEVRAMLLVEGILAKVQGEIRMIPRESGEAIHRASLEIQLDPGGLAGEIGRSAVAVPALVAAFRSEMQAPEHAQFVHWGATSQDIIDTALMLRLRQVVGIFDGRLRELAKVLGQLAEDHAELPIAGRTYGQIATPTSFGAIVAGWGAPLIRHLDRLAALKPGLLQVSLSGAAGTLSAMGVDGPAVRKAMADALNLSDNGANWHNTRDSIAELAGWLVLVTSTLGKIGEDLNLMTQSGIAEAALAQSGGSSTMPQKSNPVLPPLLVALARQNIALNSAIQGAVLHRQQRDGAAWFTEWLSLPQMCMGTARALSAMQKLATDMAPNAERMLSGIDDGLGLIYSEALSFALAVKMPRPEAQSEVKALCEEVLNSGVSLADLATQKWPDAGLGDLFFPKAQFGTAPDQARDFAAQTRDL
ncbi:MAG: class-II fumarase/aspartase family protein [Paracoccaceae bacterium]